MRDTAAPSGAAASDSEGYEGEPLAVTDRQRSLAQVLLSSIAKTTRADIHIDAAMIERVARLFSKKAIQESYLGIKSRYLFRDIRESLAGLYGVTLFYSAVFREELGIVLREPDIAYIAMLLGNASPRVPRRVRTLLGTSFDRDVARYLVRKIERALPAIEICDIVGIDEFERMDRSGYAMSISTVLVDQPDVIKVSRRVDEQDLELLEDELQLCRARAVPREWRSDCLFRDGLVAGGVAVRSRNAALQAACELLERKGCVDGTFLSELVEREGEVSSYSGRGLAVPVGYGQGVRRSAVAAVMLARPVEWEDGLMADLIFVFAIARSDEISMVDSLGALFQLVNHAAESGREIERMP